jgi:hypothetical protein
MITEMNAFHPTTKAAVAKALAEFSVELSASRVKKTPLADLIRMLGEAIATRKVAEAEPKKPSRKASNVVPIGTAKKRNSAGVNLPAKDASQLLALPRRLEAGDPNRSPRQGRDPGRTRRRPETDGQYALAGAL